MSKINAVRIVNLSYNNNTMKVNDETFEMGGESTLLSLRNGGGKSVMVQMMMAPFVNARYRDLKDRKFENYFKSNIPTYILTEWLMDNSSGYVMTGMGIKRRSVSSDEEQKDELEIITFVHEYKEGNRYDIHHFPVTEKTEKGFKVKSFPNIRSKMDEIKTDRDYVFNYFELGIDSQRKKYYETLKQYNINHREWESIIKKINLKESGLSELFAEAKTISGLVEKWFLPTVSDKLNDKVDKIKNFQDIIQKFIYQYKENENRIIRKQGIEEFNNYSIKIVNAAEDFKKTKQHTENIKNDIANLYSYISSQIEKLLHDKEDMEEKMSILKEELNEIEYERLSLEYHKINEKILFMKEEEKDLKGLIDELSIKIDSYKHETEIQECAKLYEDYKDYSRQLLTYEQKLDLAKSKDIEKQSERDNLGFTLRKIYDAAAERQKSQVNIKTEEKSEKEKYIKGLKNDKEYLDKRYNALNRECAALEANVAVYNEKENRFNTRHDKYLKRNIMGEYDDIFISSYKKEFENRFSKAEQIFNNNTKELDKSKEELNKSKSDQGELKIKETDLKNQLYNKKNELNDIKGKIEDIKKVLLYSNIDDSRLYDKEYIIKHLVRTINVLKDERTSYAKELSQEEKDKRMYETGRNIKLSEEIQQRLESMDINLIFGLEWLKKQNLSLDKKKDLIENNPFLPYSLIMTYSNLEKLKKEAGRVFTSFPIPIIEQERLEDSFEIKVVNNVYTIENMNFFISFNDKILNEQELRALLKDIDIKIGRLSSQIEDKDYEIEKYTRHKQKVEEFNVGKSTLIDLENNAEKIDRDILNVQEQTASLIDKINNLNESIKNLEKSIKENEGKKQKLQQERNDFQELLSDYEIYKVKKNDLYAKKKEFAVLDQEISITKHKIDEEDNFLENLRDQLSDMKVKLTEDEKNSKRYSNFKEGEFINKDKEDIEARYAAITSILGAEVKELEDYLTNTRNNFNKIEKELLEKTNEYKLHEADYKNVSYDSVKEKSFKTEKNKLEKQKNEKEEKIHNLQIDITKQENEKDNQLKDIYKLKKETPKDKIYITNLDFNTRKEIITNDTEACSNKINIYTKSIESLNSSKDKMDEYAGFEVTEEKIFDFPYDKAEYIRIDFIKNFHDIIIEAKSKEEILSGCCSDLSSETRFISDEFFKNTIDILGEIKSNPEDVIKTLETVNEVHKKMLEQLQSDLERIEDEKKNIIEMLYEYIQQVHEHLGRIDDNSSININGRYVKMLEIVQPKWEEKEEYYKIQVKDFVENITQNCLNELSQGKNIEEIISGEITTNKLYDNIVGISETDIKLYKIEASKQVKISWNQVSENSGGEGFLSAFVILTCLLSYMRRDEEDIFKNSQEGKVLIMDNPFAQTNAEHLLKPLMDIAKKNNTQLICFTGLGGDSIYNRFDNIYVLSLIESKLKQGVQYIESEHKKGEDRIHLTSSRFRIQEEKPEQIMLF